MIGLSIALLLGIHIITGPPRPICPAESTLQIEHHQTGVTMRCLLTGTKTRHGPVFGYEGAQLVVSTSFDHGVQQGLYRAWLADGTPTFYGTHDGKDKVGFWITWSRGRLSSYGYSSGLPRERGPFRRWTWFGNGRLDTVKTYVGDYVQHGRRWSFHKNGPLRGQSDYFEGNVVGRAFEWDEFGKFLEGVCYLGTFPPKSLWDSKDYQETLTRPCPSAEKVVGISPPPGDHRIPPPSAATNDILPPEAARDLPGFQVPVPPPFPATDVEAPKPVPVPNTESYE